MRRTNESKTKTLEPPGREGREVIQVIRIQGFLRGPRAFAVNAMGDSKFKTLARTVL